MDIYFLERYQAVNMKLEFESAYRTCCCHPVVISELKDLIAKAKMFKC